MNSLPIGLLFGLSVYKGFLVYLSATILVGYLAYKKSEELNSRSLILIIVGKLIAIPVALIIWLNWNLSIDAMFGLVFIPALIAEIIVVPLIARYL